MPASSLVVEFEEVGGGGVVRGGEGGGEGG